MSDGLVAVSSPTDLIIFLLSAFQLVAPAAIGCSHATVHLNDLIFHDFSCIF